MIEFLFSPGFGAFANLVQVGGACGIIWTLHTLLRDRRLVAIVAQNATTGDQKKIAEIPARFVTRAEILGVTAQAAGGGRLDTSLFRFNYTFDKEVVVLLPEESFKLLR